MTEREWCERIWAALVEVATAQRKITYGDLKARVGFDGWQKTFSSCLGRIANYCHQRGLPTINTLVINKTTGRPGVHIPFVEDFQEEWDRIHAFDWAGLQPPVAEDFPETACRSQTVDPL